MKTIVLPAGTEHVQFGELAHLIADALWPDAGPDDDRMTYACTRINLDAELARAVDTGALPVKDPLTLGPHPYPVGNALRTALVTVDDLQRFVSDRGLSVIVETPEPQQRAPAIDTATPAPAGPLVTASDAPAIPKNQRPDLLTPLIEKAQSGETDPFSAAVIWPKLRNMAELKTTPFIGITESGLQWIDANDSAKFLTKRALGDRLRRVKRAR